MSRKIKIEKVGATTKVTTYDSRKPARKRFYNYNESATVIFDEPNGIVTVDPTTNGPFKTPRLTFGLSELEDNFGATNFDELSTAFADNGFFNFNIGGAESESGAYQPVFNVTTFTPTIVETNNTTQIVIGGSFLDYISEVEITSPNPTGTSIAEVSKTFDELILDLEANGDVQDYDITLRSASGQEYVITISSANLTIVTPDPAGTSPALFTKTGGNNGSILTVGGYEAENNNGNGWNEHAYFGPFTSASRLEFSFKIERLQGASNAYTYIRTNNQNTASTGGQPRVYINNGTNFYVYSPTGTQIATETIAVDDVIDIVMETNKYEVFKNGISIAVYNGAVSLNNIYMNFTGYRVTKLININAKIY